MVPFGTAPIRLRLQIIGFSECTGSLRSGNIANNKSSVNCLSLILQFLNQKEPVLKCFAPVSRSLTGLIVSQQRVVLAVVLALILDVRETAEEVLAAHRSHVWAADLRNFQYCNFWFQRVVLSYDHISHLLVQFFLNLLAASARQKKIFFQHLRTDQ